MAQSDLSTHVSPALKESFLKVLHGQEEHLTHEKPSWASEPLKHEGWI